MAPESASVDTPKTSLQLCRIPSIIDRTVARQGANVCCTLRERRPGGASSGYAEVRLTAFCATRANRRPASGAVARIAMSIVLTLALSACVNVDFGSTFSVDGTASHRLAIVFQRDLLEPTEIARLTTEIAEAERRMTDDGYEIQRIDSATQIGLRAARTSADQANVATELNGLVNSMLSRADSSPIAPFQGTFTRSNPAVGGSKYHLGLKFDGPTLKPAIEALLPPRRQPASPSAVNDAVTVTYTATMPGGLQDATGQTVGESVARWTLSLDEATTIEADSTVGQNTPWVLAALAIIVAVGVIVISSVLITTILVVRRQSIERRLPMSLRISRERADELGITIVEPPTQWPEIRSAIGRSVRIALSGRRPAPSDEHDSGPDAPTMGASDGPDTQGD